MTTHELGRQLLKLPRLPVSGGNKRQAVGVDIHWMHVLNEHEFTWCQGSGKKRVKNCFGCNSKWQRLRVALIRGSL